MLTWNDIKRFADRANPTPDRRVEKTHEEWKSLLSAEQYRITRQKGTERSFSGELCGIYDKGIYSCICCGTPLFDSTIKYNSGTGWPSFTQPIKENAIKYENDYAYGMHRIEAMCNTCDAHLGHVFPDGPKPGKLRFCINSVAIQLLTKNDNMTQQRETATFGGGCFWCIEAIIQRLKGVEAVVSGYAGGATENPSYKAVCSGTTGHAEVIQVSYDPQIISYEELLVIFMTSHDPTTLNRQGADKGTQYRSIILFHNEDQKQIAEQVIASLTSYYKDPIVTEVVPLTEFYAAEDYNQNYYHDNPYAGYCRVVIDPKIKKLQDMYMDKLKLTEAQVDKDVL